MRVFAPRMGQNLRLYVFECFQLREHLLNRLVGKCKDACLSLCRIREVVIPIPRVGERCGRNNEPAYLISQPLDIGHDFQRVRSFRCAHRDENLLVDLVECRHLRGACLFFGYESKRVCFYRFRSEVGVFDPVFRGKHFSELFLSARSKFVQPLVLLLLIKLRHCRYIVPYETCYPSRYERGGSESTESPCRACWRNGDCGCAESRTCTGRSS